MKLLLSAFAALSVGMQAAAGPDQSVMPMPDTWDRTLGFLDWVYSDMTEDEIRENALNYSFVWAGLGELARLFTSANPDIVVSLYSPAFWDYYNGRPEPFQPGEGEDTLERRARTLLWWTAEADGIGHPDWVMYQCDGVTPAYWEFDGGTVPNMALDITNPDVIDWQVQYSESAMEYGFTAFSGDMFFLHNSNHACGVYQGGLEWEQIFTGEDSDPAFEFAVNSWAQQIRNRLQALPSPAGLVVNLPVYSWLSDKEIADFAVNVDGILDEQGFTGFGVDRIQISDESWVHKIRNMIAIQNQGAAYFSLNYVSTFPPTEDDIDWILGSFLMGREHAAYVLITTTDGVRWPHLPEYDEDVGHPCAPMSSVDNVYLRDYSKGLTVVNPSSTFSYTFNLPPGEFYDLYGKQIEGDTLDLGPMTGKVLLSSAERCP